MWTSDVAQYESIYRLFSSVNRQLFREANWFGINIDKTKYEPTFKIYVPGASESHWILNTVSNLGMNGYTETSAISSQHALRQSIKLYRRTNANMDALRAALLERYPMLEEHEAVIRELARMPVSDDADYRYAALFFIGVNAVKDVHDVLKFYFLTRRCPYPDKIAVRSERDDDLFMCRLHDMRGFAELCELARRILSSHNAHLWQAALDIAESGIQKRKLYLDGTDNHDLLMLASLFDSNGYGDLGDKLRTLVEWQEALHPVLSQKGFAICKSDETGYSVNMYYKEPGCGSS